MAASQATEQIPIMSAAIEITDATFEADVLRSPTLTILDLWAEWCVPCKRLAPILDEIAAQYAGKIKIAKLDVDANARTPGMYNVTGIPTLLVFKGGKLVDTIVGFLPKDKLVAKLSAAFELSSQGEISSLTACEPYAIVPPQLNTCQTKAVNRTSTHRSEASES